MSCTVEFYYEDPDEDEKHDCLKKIRRHLKKTSAFTAFKRWIVKDNEVMRADFGQFPD
ncbi:HNH endonuclease [Desulfonema ishimotonii]|uniref:HNH endonuclease n=1 Tax=Desulfonema ishimotonii TaxID=45657 RepID=A0A401G0S3_9BACT|nr:HNH endonuclease [Desulfonema ishimotonii]